MSKPSPSSLRALFDAALELSEADREALLNSQPDPRLAQAVRRMLAAESGAEARFDQRAAPAFAAASGEALADAMLKGVNIEGYQLHEVIGHGGMGRVYRATREQDGVQQRVAVKLVRPELANTALMRRFSSERKLLAGLNHPGICRFLDAGTTEDGVPFVVMELVEGKPLLPASDELRLTLRQRVKLLHEIAEVVAYAHGQLVIHRDIKAGNIMLDQHGRARLLDFGIAKSMALDADHTLTTERFLTPNSAAPEQLLGDTVGVGCDIYALGALGYEYLSGMPAFDFKGLRPAEIEQQVLRIPPKLMSERVRGGEAALASARGLKSRDGLAHALKGDLDTIIAKCLRKHPSERYTSAAELGTDLQAWLQQRPIQARGNNTRYRFRKYIERHWLALSFTSALVLTAIIGASSFVIQSMEVARQREQALAERDRARELSRVLQDAFIAADPGGALGGDVRARDILAAARPRLQSIKQLQPQAFVELATTLAGVEASLGLDQQALELVTQALAVDESAVNHPQRRELLMLQVKASKRLENHALVRTTLEEIAKIDQSRPTREPLDRQIYSAALLTDSGEGANAIQQLQRLLDGVVESDSLDPNLFRLAKTELARAFGREERFAEAVKTLEELIRWQEQHFGDSHAEVLKSRLGRIHLLNRARNFETALPEAHVVYQEISTAFGAQSAWAGQALTAVALATYNSGNVDEAVTHYQEVISIQEGTLGSNHVATIKGLYNLGQMQLASQFGHAKGIPTLRAALGRSETVLGAKANQSLFMRIGLARALLRSGEATEALETLLTPGVLESIRDSDPNNFVQFKTVLNEASRLTCKRVTNALCQAATQAASSMNAE